MNSMRRLLPILLLALSACSNHEPRPAQSDAGVDASADSLGCVPGLTNCGGVCYDLANDPTHCGTCDGVCGNDETCSDGVCQCADALERCGLSCVDPLTDPLNCGACGNTCGDEQSCQEGACVVRCDEGLTACGGQCVDTATDMVHCGGCDLPCAAGENEDAACIDGGCDILCAEDWYDLDGADGCEYFCAPDVPGVEVCDGEDNDCNGETDEDDPDYTPVDCPLQHGVCTGAVVACADGAPAECDAAAYEAVAGDRPYDPDFETWCDGIDNNCSGLADESCCDPADLPVPIPEAERPLGWDGYFDGGLLPVEGSPTPMAILTSLGTVGEETRNVVSIGFFDGRGGHARLVQIANEDLAFDADFTDVLEALWNDGLVLYTKFGGEGPVVRSTYDLDGVETSSVEVEGLNELGTTLELRGRVLDDGAELLLARVSGAGGQVAVVFEAVDGIGGRSQPVTLPVPTVRLVDVLPVGDRRVACTERSSAAPESVRCVVLDGSFVPGVETGVEAVLPPEGRPRFAETDDGWLIYLSDNSRSAAVRLTVDVDGTIAATDTAIRLVQGNVLTGRLPTGEPAALTGEERFDVDPPAFETTLLKPESGGSIIASYSAPGGAPYGFLYGDEATFVTFLAIGGIDEETPFGRVYAFRLSQDGAALCLD